MYYHEYPMQAEGSLPGSRLIVYIQEYSKDMAYNERPLVLLCPGGGYARTSDRESESMALQFMAMGCHAAVLRYSCAPAVYPTALHEAASAMKLIREHAGEWHVDEKKIIIQGCSAGGHVAASLGMFWTDPKLLAAVGAKDKEELRPNGMILCYPVITSGEFAHRGSFENLLCGKEELTEKMSLENRVNENTPKAFIWHTFEDGAVPVENSLLLVGALRRKGIPTEFHMYPRGCHGLALASRLTATSDGGHIQEECRSWIGLAKVWLENLS